jgi:hypothetical protein
VYSGCVCKAARIILPALVLLWVGCQEPARQLGITSADARRHADESLGALARCFGPLELEPALLDFRTRLVAHALIPSRTFDDGTWARPTPATRRVVFSGRPVAGRYQVRVGPAGPIPEHVAEYRGTLLLERLGPGEFEWTARDELALGSLSVDDAGRALSSWLRVIEQADESTAGVQLRASFPRTTAQLGQAFTLDSLSLVAPRSGGRQLIVQATLQPQSLSATLPHYAAFLSRYVSPSRFRLALDDPDGVRFWDLELAENHVTLRLRVHEGRVVPLAGAPRAMPPRMRATTTVSTRSVVFRIGLSQLEADVEWGATSRAAGFTARFTKTPDWELPFIVQPFLRGSLRRPFEREGALLAFTLQGGEDHGATLVTRDYRLAVRESWMMRWLGGFAGGALTEFRRESEREADRYFGETLDALRQDVVELASPPVAETARNP